MSLIFVLSAHFPDWAFLRIQRTQLYAANGNKLGGRFGGAKRSPRDNSSYTTHFHRRWIREVGFLESVNKRLRRKSVSRLDGPGPIFDVFTQPGVKHLVEFVSSSSSLEAYGPLWHTRGRHFDGPLHRQRQPSTHRPMIRERSGGGLPLLVLPTANGSGVCRFTTRWVDAPRSKPA
jgi:hypothetical protein